MINRIPMDQEYSVIRILSILLLLFLLCGSKPVITANAIAPTITVDTLSDENDHSCSDGDCSLRDAVETASSGYTIDFSVTGTITITGSWIDVEKDLTINGPGTSSLTLSGGGSGRIFYLHSGYYLTIRDLTLTNGGAEGTIYNKGELILEDCLVTGNVGGNALHNFSGTMTLNNTTVSGNSTGGDGAGIDVYGGTLTLNESIVSSNSADGKGAGINNQYGTVNLNYSVISDNDSQKSGGGISNGGILYLDGSTVSGNTAVENGGGIYSDGNTIITNSTISGNTAEINGGGIYSRENPVSDPNLTLNHATITDNTADSDNDSSGDGGGIYIFKDGPYTSIAEIKNTLIIGNSDLSGTGSEDCKNNGGSLVSEDYNLTGVGTGCALAGAHDQTSVDAMLLPLADYGGKTETHALEWNSPALNQIPSYANGCGTTYTEDQRGVLRPQGNHCDIGAYESKYDKIGHYDPATSIFYLKPANGTGWDGVNSFKFGPAGGGREPITGNWDGIEDDTIGLYDPVTSFFYLKPANETGWDGVNIFKWGPPGGGRIPIAGDWNGNGTDTVGHYDPVTSTFYLKPANETGWDGVNIFKWGPPGGGRVPITGDWDGNGTDTVGLYDPATSIFYLKPANETGWDGVIAFKFGPAGGGREPIAGDWDGDGTDTIGQYDPATSFFYLKSANELGWYGVNWFKWGPPGGGREPITGDW